MYEKPILILPTAKDLFTAGYKLLSVQADWCSSKDQAESYGGSAW